MALVVSASVAFASRGDRFDPRQRTPQSRAVRRIGRYRDDARVEAPAERAHVVEPPRIEEEGALARFRPPLKERRDRPRALVQLPERHRDAARLRVVVPGRSRRQERVDERVGLLGREPLRRAGQVSCPSGLGEHDVCFWICMVGTGGIRE